MTMLVTLKAFWQIFASPRPAKKSLWQTIIINQESLNCFLSRWVLERQGK